MTMYTLKTSREEADDILMGRKMFVFRSSQFAYAVGDRIQFQVMKQGRLIKHGIEDMTYEVSYASDLAPVEKGFTVIGFRKPA